jgi:hypothetical protein
MKAPEKIKKLRVNICHLIKFLLNKNLKAKAQLESYQKIYRYRVEFTLKLKITKTSLQIKRENIN